MAPSAASRFDPVKWTFAPSADSRRTVASPIPLVPPVTSATFPSSLFRMSLPQHFARSHGCATDFYMLFVPARERRRTYALDKVTERPIWA
jgi:hypothetical protein